MQCRLHNVLNIYYGLAVLVIIIDEYNGCYKMFWIMTDLFAMKDMCPWNNIICNDENNIDAYHMCFGNILQRFNETSGRNRDILGICDKNDRNTLLKKLILLLTKMQTVTMIWEYCCCLKKTT